MSNHPRFFLIDGNALFFRAYFAFIKNPLKNAKGENVSAIYGFANSILKLWKEHRPEMFMVVFDRKEPTFRHQIYKEYKANREKMPEDLASQIPVIFEFLEKMGVPQISVAGYEADDIMGTLCTLASKKSIDTYLVTSDKDLFQLISDRVFVFNIRSLMNPKEKQIYRISDVPEKFGVSHERVIDFLSLTGDASDNVPGVPGVGEKTAARLIRDYGGVDEIYAHLDRVMPESLRKKLQDAKSIAELSKKLVTIVTDMDLHLDPVQVRSPQKLPFALENWFEEKEFHSLKKIFKDCFEEKKQESVFIETILLKTESQWEDFIQSLGSPCAVFGFMDLEKKFSGLGFYSGEQAACLPLPLLKEVKKSLADFLNDTPHVLAGLEVKELLKHLWALDVPVLRSFFDLSLAGFLLNPDQRNPKFKDLVGVFLGEVFEEGFQITEKNWGQIAKIFLSLFSKMQEAIEKKKLGALLQDIEIPMVYVLARMEHTGIAIDRGFLEELHREMLCALTALEKSIIDFAGVAFNVNSPKQLGEILFEKLKIQDNTDKKIKKGKTGYSTAVEVLERYTEYPIVKAILRHRTIAKLLNTYVDALADLVNPETGRLHTTFNQMVAVTGRLSSMTPNIQNIPIRTVEGAKLRKAFVAAEGKLFLSADYSQIELRILAHFSEDPLLCEAFRKGQDIHAETAARIFSVPLSDVTSEQRSRAKAVNFGVVYGMGPYKLSQDTGLFLKEAAAFIENYFSVYRGVKAFIQRSVSEVKQRGETRTLFHRLRSLPDIHSHRKDLQIFAEHSAVNTPIQGTAADLIKIAMVRIQKRLEACFPETKILLQIHDELLLEVPEKDIENVKKVVQQEMTQVFPLQVPLEISLGVGKNWLEAHP
jgi:DNA polymerase-1